MRPLHVPGGTISAEFRRNDLITPAFVYDEDRLVSAAEHASNLASAAGCRLLYTLKPFSYIDALRLIAPSVSGFAAASAFEARLARDVIGRDGSVHASSPALRLEDAASLKETCDYVSFNSLTQFDRLKCLMMGNVSMGLRINPQLSFVPDPRYDPCRTASKLGVPLKTLKQTLDETPERLEGIEGFHFHSNCDSSDLGQLQDTVSRLVRTLGSSVFKSLRWINLGGGYLLGEHRQEDLCAAVNSLREYDLEVFIEPGAAIVRESGCLVSSVVDLFESDGRQIAMLDTTINHCPEVFEYQFEPDVAGDCADGEHEYILAGSSCLAGDVFGSYAFAEPLQVGSRVVFANTGAYTLVKAHMFNGINLPRVYARTREGRLMLKKAFSYEDYAQRCGAA